VTGAVGWRRGVVFVFGVYAGVLFVGTHWPALRIEGPVRRPDLIVHFGAFGLWTFLLMMCGVWGRVSSWRNLGWSVMVGLAYAGIDEGLQAVPALRRTCAWDDYAANAGGVLIAAGVVALGARVASGWWGRREAWGIGGGNNGRDE
jgi:hypothetical protein